MKRAKTKIITTLLALTMAFSLTACAQQEDIDNAIKPVNQQITVLDSYIDELETKVATLETDLDTVNDKLETLNENSATKEALENTKNALQKEIDAIKADIGTLQTNGSAFQSELEALNRRVTTLETTLSSLSVTVTGLQAQVEENKNKIEQLEQENATLKEQINVLNCLNDIHELNNASNNGDNTHTGVCKHCEIEFTVDCSYGDLVSNDNGTQSKTCSTCKHTSVTFTKIWEDSLTLDISTLLNITEEKAVYTLISTPATNYGSLNGTILSCPLKGDYVITVTVEEVLTHTFTVSITNNPATGGFDGPMIEL